ncbi:MAG TPA: DUF6088 family protein [Puia sp.]|nr:DUF6088 family protein [Puia sp.]
MSASASSRLLSQIVNNGKGKLVFPADFIALGSNESIRKALSQLVKDRILVRLGQGIYLFPEFDPELGILYPSPEEIAESIARRDKARIIPTGAYALYKLKLSEQVPMKLAYLTDGVRRTIKLGENTITFTITTPKRLAARGKVSGLVIQALLALGKKQLDEKIIKKISKALANEDDDMLRHDAGIAPAWVASILLSILKNKS